MASLSPSDKEKSAPTVYSLPVFVDGILGLLVTDGEDVWPVYCSHGAWLPGGLRIDEILKGPPASDKRLAFFGLDPASLVAGSPIDTPDPGDEGPAPAEATSGTSG